MRRIGRLMLPAIAGLAAVQVNIIVNTIFATSEEGAAAWLIGAAGTAGVGSGSTAATETAGSAEAADAESVNGAGGTAAATVSASAAGAGVLVGRSLGSRARSGRPLRGSR